MIGRPEGLEVVRSILLPGIAASSPKSDAQVALWQTLDGGRLRFDIRHSTFDVDVGRSTWDVGRSEWWVSVGCSIDRVTPVITFRSGGVMIGMPAASLTDPATRPTGCSSRDRTVPPRGRHPNGGLALGPRPRRVGATQCVTRRWPATAGRAAQCIARSFDRRRTKRDRVSIV
jgi:hypothetical protein